MAWGCGKTEHSGAKQAKGFWGKKAYAKKASKKARRQNDKASSRS